MKVAVGWLAVAAVAGFVVGLAVTRGAPARPSGAIEAAPTSDPRLAAIASDLAAVRRQLALRAADAPASPERRMLREDGTTSDDTPVLLALDSLQKHLDAELAELSRLITERETAQTRLARMREEGRGIDWAALNALVATWRFDRDAAEKDVELLTAEQVLDRFGPPSRVYTNTNGLHWEYTGKGAGDWKQVILRVPDGYVTNLIVR